MTDAAIVVFTGRGRNQILREGGSQAWALNAQRARKCSYLALSARSWDFGQVEERT